MRLTRGQWRLATTLLIGLGITAVAAPGSEEPDQKLGPNAFVKVGSYRINISRINYTIDDGENLLVFFGGGSDKPLKLEGKDAVEFRRWLDRRCLETVTQLLIPNPMKIYQGERFRLKLSPDDR